MATLLIAIALVMLSVGFYLAYFRSTSAPGKCCSSRRTGSRRLQRGILWVSALLVAAFIFFPDYVAALTRGERAGPTSTLESGRTLIFDVQGMTCEGCAATLRNRLVKIEGVADVRVHYAQRIAEVHAAGDHVSDRVTAAVAELGYTATPR